MTGFDPTAPARDTDNDPPDAVPGNVVPPDGLSGSNGDEAQEGEAPSEGDGDVAPTGEDVVEHTRTGSESTDPA